MLYFKFSEKEFTKVHHLTTWSQNGEPEIWVALSANVNLLWRHSNHSDFSKYRKNSQTGFPFQISWENDSERLSFVQKCQLSLVSRPVLFSLFAWRFCFDDIWFCLYHWWRYIKSLFVKMAYIFNFSVVWYKGCHCMWSGQFHKLQYSTEPGGTEYCERIHNVRTRFYWKYKHYGWYREKGQKCTLYSNSLGDIGFTAVKINWVN